jgi:predicted NBD/HSP70 family sugar kinase/biotin operon repressor
VHREIPAARPGNRDRVIELLRTRGALTRADLARLLNVSRATVSNVVAALQDAGLLVESGSTGGGVQQRRGRPGSLLTLNPSAGAVVGIDFGHTHVRVIVADLAHTVLAEHVRTLERDHDARDALRTAVVLAREALAAANVVHGKVIGVGAGVPGPINTRTGAIGSSSIGPSWVGLRPAEELGALLGLPVVVDNVGNLGALAEVTWGAGRGAQVAVYIKLDAGVGAGFVLGGRLYRGACGTAAEFGHMTVDPTGPICRCGNRGCLETFVSVPALLDQLRSRHDAEFTTQDMVRSALDGDRAGVRVLTDAGQRIGAAIAIICNLVNPDRVVIGGELSAAYDILLPPLRAVLERDALPFASAQATVCRGQLGDRAVALGSVAAVLHSTSGIHRRARADVPGAEQNAAMR